ncbi:unnamed protein product [Adineta steineri]|uniref:G-protein coupled receptors family 1 profile domain-containing protein n=1 Tax=Adineta steineri TaxID=433720 RepID=A0A815VTC4_9BILA|nr:unnamed protein product [Adineta steineri]CAF1534564.1 unnamed protein product [Adineta steineri]CAF1648275.1 unnamed protein product [Adineta steineri]CAF1654999.1 unnamed protein product [Adineta steineri]
MSLVYIGQQITIYVGFFFVVIGIVGNGINILVFLKTRTYRTTCCTFYFLISSIVNIAFIITNITSRIVSSGFGIDVTRTLVLWCKARQYFVITFASITFTCSCLATIDQFFVTSQNADLRNLSKMKRAHRITLIMIIIWCVHGIPCFIFYNISPVTKTCMSMNTLYAIYIIIHLLAILSAIPVLIMIVFGYLTYRNIQLTQILALEQADRQLIRMTMFQVILVIFSLVPYGGSIAYNLITSGNIKDPNRVLVENFFTAIFNLFPYFYYTGSCYMFLISSSRFRRATKEQIFFWRRWNRVLPTSVR